MANITEGSLYNIKPIYEWEDVATFKSSRENHFGFTTHNSIIVSTFLKPCYIIE